MLTMRLIAAKLLIRKTTKKYNLLDPYYFAFKMPKSFLYLLGESSAVLRVTGKGESGFISEILLSSTKSRPLTCIHDQISSYFWLPVIPTCLKAISKADTEVFKMTFAN